MSSLFSPADLKKYSEQTSAGSFSPSGVGGEAPFQVTRAAAHHISGIAEDVLKEITDALQAGTHIHWRSKGHFSMHDLLKCLLKKTGPADVYFTTWALTETPAKEIVQLVDQGNIKKLFCVFDYKINDRSNAPVKMVEKFATRFAYAKCHAKMMVLINDEFAISVAGSANFTRNPRMEAGVIVRDRNVAQMDIDWITETLNESKNNSQK